jgi:hypothetical protein
MCSLNNRKRPKTKATTQLTGWNTLEVLSCLNRLWTVVERLASYIGGLLHYLSSDEAGHRILMVAMETSKTEAHGSGTVLNNRCAEVGQSSIWAG